MPTASTWADWSAASSGPRTRWGQRTRPRKGMRAIHRVAARRAVDLEPATAVARLAAAVKAVEVKARVLKAIAAGTVGERAGARVTEPTDSHSVDRERASSRTGTG